MKGKLKNCSKNERQNLKTLNEAVSVSLKVFTLNIN